MTASLIRITTEDGVALEAEQFVGESPRAVVVIAHPHPTMGGDMYTPVPAAVFGSLERLNLTGVRFNFRGVGRSEGSHDQGAAEILDVQAVVNVAALLAPEVPLVMAGWSWGADLSMMCADPRVAGWVLAAPPLKVHDPDTMAARTSLAPKVFAVPEHDQFSSPDQTATTVADWENARVVTVPGTDHFFGGQLDEVVRLVNELVNELVDEVVDEVTT